MPRDIGGHKSLGSVLCELDPHLSSGFGWDFYGCSIAALPQSVIGLQDLSLLMLFLEGNYYFPLTLFMTPPPFHMAQTPFVKKHVYEAAL